ncbi:MAG: hypothetical protein NT028_12185, partial [candidate division Zixibacteria bacterium]|nr:hypothetical protein [candidate division Zixibacteria bacterium]
LEVLSIVCGMNQEVDRFWVNLDRTFDSTLSSENRERLQSNIHQSYLLMFTQAKRLIRCASEAIASLQS